VTPQPTRAAGERAERLAADHLVRHGLKLLERNFRCRGGEVDLVMRDREHLVFVEVRMRSNPLFGSAVETVNGHKQRRVITAARYYLARHPSIAPCRFDVVGIDGTGRIDWIRDAFGT
jgi:putative endonuclease